MRRSLFIPNILILLSTLTFIFSSAQGAECFDSSPSVKNNIDMYEEIQARELTPVEFEQLTKLFKDMRGDWSGKAETVRCKGTVAKPREEKIEYTVDADVEPGLSNNIDIKLSLNSSEKKQVYEETQHYFLTPKRLGVTDTTRAGDVQLINIARNFLVYLRKHNQRTTAGGLVAQEFVKTIAMYGDTLMMQDFSYSNGVLDSKRTLTLSHK
jgi:hypothetical protein